MSSRESLIMALYETIKQPPKNKEPDRYDIATGTLHSKQWMERNNKKKSKK